VDRVPRSIVDVLLRSSEPSIRWKLRVKVLGEDPDGRAARRIQGEVKRSAPARALIEGHRVHAAETYAKWVGGHWVLASLADVGYPPGDAALAPLREEILRTWLHPYYLREAPLTAEHPKPSSRGVPIVTGRARSHASQQGSALLSLVKLGLADDRAAELAQLLLRWQWPDAGWNCDPKPQTTVSSMHETWLPLRGLAAYGMQASHQPSLEAARRAADTILDRRVLYRRSTGELIHRDWAKLRYPSYWHYDLLAGLKSLAELGLAGDQRCTQALDLLESKQLANGGWPAEAAYHRGFGEKKPSFDHVDWGRPDRGAPNEWVTAEALAVLAAAGRL
jgi:hypothetical protein